MNDMTNTPFPPQERSDGSSLVRGARQDLLARIGDFILRYDLDVTAANLALVCNALSGSNAPLARAFAAREMSGEAIDQRWINTIARFDPGINDQMNELEKLTDQLEYSLMRFAQTTRFAQDETSDHRGLIDKQIIAMAKECSDTSGAGDNNAQPESAGEDRVSRVINLSRAMIERVRQIEDSMERSHSETEALRTKLAKARMEADVDHLTRLPNRRAFERRLTAADAEARRCNEPLSIAFCDVDNFKKVNDTHGHEAGDRILCAIAATLNDIACDQCFIGRHGGEEFVLLFYGLDKEAAWRKLDGVRRALAAKQLMNRETGKPFGRITFSGGIAEVTEETDSRSALIRADNALYQAKAGGRNRIVAI